MKYLTIAFVLMLASACSSSPPLPPQPKGELTDVNPKNINIEDLINKNK